MVADGQPQEAEELAQAFHEAYERLAPEFMYKTRDESAVAWEDVPENNKQLMIAVAGEILFSLDAGASSGVGASPLGDGLGLTPSAMPDTAKLTYKEIQKLLEKEFGKHLSPLVRVTDTQNLVRDAAAEKAWHARDEELAFTQMAADKWREIANATEGKTVQLQKELDDIREALAANPVAREIAERNQVIRTLGKERDAALEQVRALAVLARKLHSGTKLSVQEAVEFWAIGAKENF